MDTKAIKTGLIITLCVCLLMTFLMMDPMQAHASVTWSQNLTRPSEAPSGDIPTATYQLTMKPGKIDWGETTIPHFTRNSVKAFTVARPSNRKAATYSNVGKVTFRDCGLIYGKQTKVTITITKVELDKHSDRTDKYNKGDIVIAYVDKTAFRIGGDSAAPLKLTQNMWGGKMRVTYKADVKYMDGTEVNYPFVIGVYDIDQVNEGVHEGVSFGNHITGARHWNACVLKLSNIKAYIEKDNDMTGNASWTKGGFLAYTSETGSYTMTHFVGRDMATRVLLYKQINADKLQIIKRATDEKTAGIAPYTMDGIEYSIYGTRAEAQEQINALQTVRLKGTVTGTNDWTKCELPASAGGTTYYVRETATNQYYEKSNTIYQVKLTPKTTNTPTVLQVKDDPNFGSLTFTKEIRAKDTASESDVENIINANKGAYYPLLEFTLRNVNANDITYKVSPDENGVVSFQDIPFGTYSLTESGFSAVQTRVDRAKDLVGSSGSHSGELTSRTSLQTVTVSGEEALSTSGNKWINEWESVVPMEISVYKHTNDGSTDLSGWMFEVYDSNNHRIGDIVTDENGAGSLAVSDPGFYTVKEVMTSIQQETYRCMGSDEQTGTLSRTSPNLVFEFDNNLRTSDVLLTKLELKDNGEFGANTDGIEFTLYKTNINGGGRHFIAKGVTSHKQQDGSSSIVFDGEDNNITKGWYVLEETGFPALDSDGRYVIPDAFQLSGYDNPAFLFGITGNEGVKEIVFTNTETVSEGTITVNKMSSDSAASELSGYTFNGIRYGIYRDRQCTELEQDLTIRDLGTYGTAQSDVLEDGSYFVKEISAGESGYNKNSEVQEAVITAGRPVTLSFEDDPVTGSFSFTKKINCSEARAKIPDPSLLEFTLRSTEKPSVSYTEHPDSSGSVTFKSVLIGEYTLTESGFSNYTGGILKALSGSRIVDISEGENGLEGGYINLWEPDEPPAGIHIVKKTDNAYVTDLSEFTFSVTDEEGNSYEPDAIQSENGDTYVRGLYPGTYTIHEQLSQNQKKLYRQPADQQVIITEETSGYVSVEFRNRVKTTDVRLIKHSNDNRVGDINFMITGTAIDGQKVLVSGTTVKKEEGNDTYGEVVFEAPLKPGNYVIEETGYNADKYAFPQGYTVSAGGNPAKAFAVTGTEENGHIVIPWVNTAYTFSLDKTIDLEDGTTTNEPLNGATYTLYKVDDASVDYDDVDELGAYEYRRFTTGEGGTPGGYFSDFIDGGKYVVYETEAPEGYVFDGPKKVGLFSLDSQSVSAELTDSNRRDYGVVSFIKTDDTGNPVEGAKYALFTDPECTQVAENADGVPMEAETDAFGGITDAEGASKFSRLPWGRYYLKETETPRGYEINSTVYPCIVDQYNTDIIVADEGKDSIVDSRSRGSVELTKYDESGSVRMNGAEYSLYTQEGELIVEGLITGADNNGDGNPDGMGKILYEGLSWGGYYFQETKAPPGYSLSQDFISFSVNSLSGGQTQYLKAIDRASAANIVATGRIRADQYYAPHGDPTFFLILEGTTVSGRTVTYKEPVTFDKDYIGKFTDAEGYVSKSVSFSVETGTYTLSSTLADKYYLKASGADRSPSDIDCGQAGEEYSVSFTINDGDRGAATYTYLKEDYNGVSDQTSVLNLIKKAKAYTGLTVRFTGKQPVDAGMPFIPDDLLDVTALFDDGSGKSLKYNDGEYTVYDSTGSLLTETPTIPGSYTYYVSAEIRGVTRTSTFTIKVKEREKITISFFDSDGATRLLDDTQIWQYQSIAQAMPPSDYIPVKEGHYFNGWYKNKALTNPFDSSERLSEDTALYAKMTRKTYTVSYDATRGTGAPASQTKTWGEDLLLSQTIPVVNNGQFLGWSRVQGQTADLLHPGDRYTDNCSVRFYAVWKMDYYCVSYHLNGGNWAAGETPSGDALRFTYNSVYQILEDEPYRPGFDFAGWGISSSATEASYYPGDVYRTNDDLELYALWTPKTYTITYDGAGTAAYGTVSIANQTKTHGQTINLRRNTPTNVKPGYTFVGWSDSTDDVLIKAADLFTGDFIVKTPMIIDIDLD